jgi:hypothetical protein
MNKRYIAWAILFVVSYPIIAYSLGSRWDWWLGVVITSMLYLLWKPWLISPFEGTLRRERTKSEKLFQWFKQIHNEQK